MKKQSLRTILFVTLALTIAPVSVLADNEQGTQAIEGVWDVSVTILDCNTHAQIVTVQAMNMFIHGGTLTETANSFLRGSSLGTWRHLGGPNYTAVFRFFTFNANGSPTGRNVITRNIALSQDADKFTAAAVFQIFDATGKLTGTGCATETATRLE
jgi:hypothetical protein